MRYFDYSKEYVLKFIRIFLEFFASINCCDDWSAKTVIKKKLTMSTNTVHTYWFTRNKNMYHFSGMTYCKSAAESMTLGLPNRSINSDWGGQCQFFQCPAWWLSPCRCLPVGLSLPSCSRPCPTTWHSTDPGHCHCGLSKSRPYMS